MMHRCNTDDAWVLLQHCTDDVPMSGHCSRVTGCVGISMDSVGVAEKGCVTWSCVLWSSGTALVGMSDIAFVCDIGML